MARVLAVFSDGTQADKARDSLETTGHGDDVNVITVSNREPEGVEPIPGSSSQAGAAVVGTTGGAEPVMGHATLVDLGLSSEEEDFYRRTLDEGSQMISVETDDPGEVSRLLEKAGADRVDTIG